MEMTLPVSSVISFTGVESTDSGQGKIDNTGKMFTWDKLAPLDQNASLQAIFTGEVDTAAIIGSSHTLTGTGDWYSLPDTPAANQNYRRAYSDSDDILIGIDSEVIGGGIVADSYDETPFAPDPVDFLDLIESTADVVIGEQIDWQYKVYFPVGISNALNFSIELPVGMQVDTEPVLTASTGLSPIQPLVLAGVGNGNPVTFPFTSTSDTVLIGRVGSTTILPGDLADRVLDLTFSRLITNDASIALDQTAAWPELDFEVSHSGATPTSTHRSNLTLVEAALTIITEIRNKTIGDPTDFSVYSAPDAGDELEVRLTVNNATSQTVTAHDLGLISAQQNTVYNSMLSAVLTAGDGSTTDLLPGRFIPASDAGNLLWGAGVASHPVLQVEPNGSLRIVYNALASDPLAIDDTVGVTAAVTWKQFAGHQPG